jgi:hypothetical protein
MFINKSQIKEAKSLNFGYSKKQIEVLGLNWPPIKGWTNRILLIDLKEEQILQFINLKNEHL